MVYKLDPGSIVIKTKPSWIVTSKKNLVQAPDENASSGDDKDHPVAAERVVVDAVTLSEEVKA
jgi:hypothetical protein